MNRFRSGLLGALGAVVIVVGSWAAADSTSAAQASAIRARMHAQLAAAKAIQLSIAIGDLDRARTEARRIAEQGDVDGLPEWRPYLADIRARARQVAASTDTVAAAKTMAQLGRSCARCHDANHAKVTFPEEPAPQPSPKLAAQMAVHQWAAARMWEGLIGNSSELWLAGARTLATARMLIAAETGEIGIADDAARAKLLAERATKLDDRSDRAMVYGELLATCAHCHATIRDQRPR